MKLIKKLDANNNVIFVNSETNEVIDVEVQDQAQDQVKAKYDETIKVFMEEQEKANKQIQELIAANKAAKENEIKNEFINAGGNPNAWDVYKLSNQKIFDSQDIKGDILKSKQEQSYLFNGSPDHTSKPAEEDDNIIPNCFYRRDQ